MLNNNKKVIAKGDAWPHSHKLIKGSYTVRFAVRHESKEVLDKLKEIPVSVVLKLPTKIKLKFYKNPLSAYLDQGSFPDTRINLGSTITLYVKAPTDSLPKWIKAGDTLTGNHSSNVLKILKGLVFLGAIKYLPANVSDKRMRSGSFPFLYHCFLPKQSQTTPEVRSHFPLLGVRIQLKHEIPNNRNPRKKKSWMTSCLKPNSNS